jgi:deoxycytidine triphosphate deaminase
VRGDDEDKTPIPPAASPVEPTFRGLMGPKRLLDVLQDPAERIFKTGTWDPKCIKGAGYELRLAPDWMVVPDASQPGGYRAVSPHHGPPPQDYLTLDVGETAAIATIESWSMDFGVTAVLGPKFRWASQGLLLLQGGAAHPGYGRLRNDAGTWVPSPDDVRLYHVITNIGPRAVTLRAGDVIGYAQFFEIEPAESPREVKNIGFESLVSLMRGPAVDGGLNYFRTVTELRDEVEGQRRAHDLYEAKIEQKLSGLSDEISHSRSNEQVVLFGVFLVAATILGVTLTVLFSVVKGLPVHLVLWKWIVIAGLSVLYAAAVCGVAAVAVRALAPGRRAAGKSVGTQAGAPGSSASTREDDH